MIININKLIDNNNAINIYNSVIIDKKKIKIIDKIKMISF